MGCFEPDDKELQYLASTNGVMITDKTEWYKGIAKMREKTFLVGIYALSIGIILGLIIGGL